MHNNIKSILNENGFTINADTKNIYMQLFSALRKAIIERSINEGSKLPPSRILSSDLNISRSTVIKAYELLVLEKYIKSIQGSGYFVASVRHKKNHFHFNTNPKKEKLPKISKRGKSFSKFGQAKEENNRGIAFRPGLPPLDIFPVNLWKNLSNNYWKTVRASQLSYSNTIGIERLRQNVSEYLRIYRNINSNPDQIVITTGSLHSLSLIADALIDKNDEVILENPTYPHANNLFNSLKAKVIPARIDIEGVKLDGFSCSKPKLIYVTPSNQYPSGVKMSLKRRLELIKWASQKNSLIIEDDYDHEFSNWEKPISSIFSLDKEDRTVYLGTFNKLLHPSIRVGYMIVPEFLQTTVQSLYEQSSRFVSPSTQTILSYFIEKDYLNKHLRKTIETSIERKEFFLDYFTKVFENDIKINSHNTGLHIIGELEMSKKDIELSKYLYSKGIIAHPFSNYYINGQKQNGLVMGYGSVNTKVIKETIDKMKREFLNFLS